MHITGLVMFGSRRRLSASWVSAIILRIALSYATLMGIICFRVRRNGADGRLVAQNLYWYKWFALLTRILMSIFYFETNQDFIPALSIFHLKFMIGVRLSICLICAVITMVLQFWYGQRVLRVVNSYLRLFRRLTELPGCQESGFGGKWVLSALLLKMLCMVYEIGYLVPTVLAEFDTYFALSALCDIYNTVNAAMLFHICFLGYLSIGILYDHVNNYVRNELRQQLSALRQPNGGKPSRRQLEAAGYRLDECLAIYDEIHQLGSTFHKLFEFPLCFIMMFGFLSMALVAFFITYMVINSTGLWILEIKIFIDVLLLTLVVHNAGNSSRVIRRLSLENYYVGESKDWHMKMEMFLSRLNYYEFRVCPLGLFDVSNGLMCVFLSGLVTYLIYILQYGKQWEKF